MSAIVPFAEVSRATQGSSEWTTPIGKLLVSLDTCFASVDGRPVHLTHKEYGILQLLCLRKGSTVTKQMLYNHLYSGMTGPHPKIIDVYVCKLRKKLVELTGEDYIGTVWGRGYILRDPAATAIQSTSDGTAKPAHPSRYDAAGADDPAAALTLRAVPELHDEPGRSLDDH